MGEMKVYLCLHHGLYALRGMCGVRAIPQILLYLSDLALGEQAKHLDFCLLK